MFERLQKKWKVNGLQLVLILCTFAIGGSLTAFVGKKLMNGWPLNRIGYGLLSILYWSHYYGHMAVLLVSLFFGQFRFFLKYIKKIGARMGIGSQKSEDRKSEVGQLKTD